MSVHPPIICRFYLKIQCVGITLKGEMNFGLYWSKLAPVLHDVLKFNISQKLLTVPKCAMCNIIYGCLLRFRTST